MNRIFRTVWNRVRRQLVAVKGSVVNAQPVNTVGVTLKKSALALSLPVANPSWIDDNGGVDGSLT